MKQIIIITGLLFLSINSQSQGFFGKYISDRNPIVRLVINSDSTFSYVDWLFGSCWAQVHKSGFVEINNDTLVLISNGRCRDCLEFAFTNYADTTKLLLFFDPEIKKKFPDLKVSFDFDFEKRYDIDSENKIIRDLIVDDTGFLHPYAIHLRSRNFNADIYLDFEFALANKNSMIDRTVHDNFISIRLKPDFEKGIEAKQIFAKYLLIQSGRLKLCDSIDSIAESELRRADITNDD